MIASLFGRQAIRLALAILVSAGLCLPLGFVFAVQRALDPDRHATVIHVTSADRDRVAQDFGPTAYTAAEWTLPVRHGDDETAVRAMVTDTTGPEARGFFSGDTAIASQEVEGNRWIDVSADLARQLGVGPGDTVEAGTDPSVELTVRSIHMLRLDGYPLVAQIPSDAFDSKDDYQSILIISGSASGIEDNLNDSFYKERLLEAGYPGLEPIRPFTELHAHQAERSFIGLGLVLGTAVLAAVAGVAILLRESWVYAKAISPTLGLLADLGTAPRELRRVPLLLGALALAVGVTGGSVIGLLPYQLGLLGPGLPPSLYGAWAGAAGGLLVAALIVIAAVLRRRRRVGA